MLDTRNRHSTDLNDTTTTTTMSHSSLLPHTTTTTTTSSSSASPLLMRDIAPHKQTSPEDDEERGEKREVGRKRRLAASIDTDTDTDTYRSPHATNSDTNPRATKRPHTTDEAEQRPTGCTDEWRQHSPTRDIQLPHEDTEAYEEVEEDEDDDEEVDDNTNNEEEDDEHSEEEEPSREEEDDEDDDEQNVYREVPHPAPRTWVAKAEWSLGRLGGRGTLADIYSTIEEYFPEEIDGKRNWKAAIRSCLSKNEKNKFFKPRSSSLSSKDHVWCLANGSRHGGSRALTPTKRGRPAGRGRRSAAAPRQKQQQQVVEHEQQLPDAPVHKSDDEARRAALLVRKQQLELDISRLQQEVGDGLSADQEDFLSQLLG